MLKCVECTSYASQTVDWRWSVFVIDLSIRAIVFDVGKKSTDLCRRPVSRTKLSPVHLFLVHKLIYLVAVYHYVDVRRPRISRRARDRRSRGGGLSGRYLRVKQLAGAQKCRWSCFEGEVSGSEKLHDRSFADWTIAKFQWTIARWDSRTKIERRKSWYAKEFHYYIACYNGTVYLSLSQMNK